MPLVSTVRSGESRSNRETPFDIDQAIRRCAYQFYEQRGYVDGHDVEDWLVAEQEIRREEKRQASAVG